MSKSLKLRISKIEKMKFKMQSFEFRFSKFRISLQTSNLEFRKFRIQGQSISIFFGILVRTRFLIMAAECTALEILKFETGFWKSKIVQQNMSNWNSKFRNLIFEISVKIQTWNSDVFQSSEFFKVKMKIKNSNLLKVWISIFKTVNFEISSSNFKLRISKNWIQRKIRFF